MILGVCLGAAKSLVVEIGILLEAQAPSELPEQMLGIGRVIHPDTTKSRKIKV
jgi:hypothetical protein